MANLQKIVKVTQQQYDILASGGIVGSYTGLNDNYVYLVEDTNTYITSNGGTIDNDNIDFHNGYGIAELDNNNVFAGFCIDYYSGEIIYNSSNHYRPLFANDDSFIIYSEDDNYNQSTTINTSALFIGNYTATNNYINISSSEGIIYYYNAEDDNEYTYTLPSTSGTIALTSDIPSVSLNTAAGSESITVNSDSLNVVTRDTAQDISGVKNIIGDSLHLKYSAAASNFWHIETDNYSRLSIARTWNGIKAYYWKFDGNTLHPNSDKGSNIGTYNRRINKLYVYQLMSSGSNTYGIILPDTTSFTADKTLATTDEIPQVKRYI